MIEQIWFSLYPKKVGVTPSLEWRSAGVVLISFFDIDNGGKISQDRSRIIKAELAASLRRMT